MANSGKATATIEDLLVSSLASNDALAKLLHREAHHHGAGVFAEDFRGASDVSTDVQSYASMMTDIGVQNHGL